MAGQRPPSGVIDNGSQLAGAWYPMRFCAGSAHDDGSQRQGGACLVSVVPVQHEPVYAPGWGASPHERSVIPGHQLQRLTLGGQDLDKFPGRIHKDWYFTHLKVIVTFFTCKSHKTEVFDIGTKQLLHFLTKSLFKHLHFQVESHRRQYSLYTNIHLCIYNSFFFCHFGIEPLLLKVYFLFICYHSMRLNCLPKVITAPKLSNLCGKKNEMWKFLLIVQLRARKLTHEIPARLSIFR
jgi:hypothetical protein